MANALDDNITQTHVARPQQEPSTGYKDEKLDGKSFQINENSVEEGDPIHTESAPQQPPQQPHDPSDEKLQGRSFQVNENSVEEGEPVHPRNAGLPK